MKSKHFYAATYLNFDRPEIGVIVSVVATPSVNVDE